MRTENERKRDAAFDEWCRREGWDLAKRVAAEGDGLTSMLGYVAGAAFAAGWRARGETGAE